MSEIRLAELVDLIHNRFRWPRPTNIFVGEASVHFRLGVRKYMAFGDRSVMELLEGGVVKETLHSRYAQGLLRGGKRNEDGTLIVPGE